MLTLKLVLLAVVLVNLALCGLLTGLGDDESSLFDDMSALTDSYNKRYSRSKDTAAADNSPEFECE